MNEWIMQEVNNRFISCIICKENVLGGRCDEYMDGECKEKNQDNSFSYTCCNGTNDATEYW